MKVQTFCEFDTLGNYMETVNSISPTLSNIMDSEIKYKNLQWDKIIWKALEKRVFNLAPLTSYAKTNL